MADECPKVLRMVEFSKVAKLVNHDVIGYFGWEKEKLRV